MKKFIFVIILAMFTATMTKAQENESEIFLLIKNLKDKQLSKKLKKFANQGVEKELNLKQTTPDSLINAAKKYLGTPHKMGGIDTKGIDCSGLLYASFRDIGISIPHNSEEMARYGKIKINADSLKRGDLVFFVKTYNTPKVITHSGIYLGEGKFIHTSAKRGVIISDLNTKYYKEHFIFGTEIFTDNN